MLLTTEINYCVEHFEVTVSLLTLAAEGLTRRNKVPKKIELIHKIKKLITEYDFITCLVDQHIIKSNNFSRYSKENLLQTEYLTLKKEFSPLLKAIRNAIRRFEVRRQFALFKQKTLGLRIKQQQLQVA